MGPWGNVFQKEKREEKVMEWNGDVLESRRTRKWVKAQWWDVDVMLISFMGC